MCKSCLRKSLFFCLLGKSEANTRRRTSQAPVLEPKRHKIKDGRAEDPQRSGTDNLGGTAPQMKRKKIKMRSRGRKEEELLSSPKARRNGVGAVKEE